MSYIHLNIGNRCFSIHQAQIEIFVYGTSYCLINWFILKFLINYNTNDPDNNDQDNSKNSTVQDSKHKNKIEIIRDGDDSISNELLATIIEKCFQKDVSYQITHPELVDKIRSFLKVSK